jgi:hypothetical protein
VDAGREAAQERESESSVDLLRSTAESVRGWADGGAGAPGSHSELELPEHTEHRGKRIQLRRSDATP